jgi:hypothetical protein
MLLLLCKRSLFTAKTNPDFSIAILIFARRQIHEQNITIASKSGNNRDATQDTKSSNHNFCNSRKFVKIQKRPSFQSW